MNSSKFDKAYDETIIQIKEILDKFRDKLHKGSSKPDSFMKLDEIEKEWYSLINDTHEIYSKLLEAYLADLKNSRFDLNHEDLDKIVDDKFLNLDS